MSSASQHHNFFLLLLPRANVDPQITGSSSKKHAICMGMAGGRTGGWLGHMRRRFNGMLSRLNGKSRLGQFSASSQQARLSSNFSQMFAQNFAPILVLVCFLMMTAQTFACIGGGGSCCGTPGCTSPCGK
ncbi:unnamed protein product [Caenorhabditis auriculariae]|uniref:Uncharacterized protein n=1 Tax=Caenorhabditis auriculariae TaxID=2777116 RepID=A0A8S1GTS0_9PELO|nr:unnamed protein product [Caenorhabditis auriculariae]